MRLLLTKLENIVWIIITTILIFLQIHREIDRFFAVSGVQVVQTVSYHFHFRHAAFSVHLRVKIGNILTKDPSLRITLNIDDTPITSRSHTHPSHSEASRLLTSFLSLSVPVPHTVLCMSDV